MLSESEEFLLGFEKGENFEANFNGVFRAFHSLKGAAGMFEILPLQEFMHKVEGQFESLREKQKITQEQVDYFLQAIDTAKSLIALGTTTFDTDLFDQINGEKKAQAAPEVKTEQAPAIKEPLAQKEKVKERKERKKERKAQKKRGLVYVVDDEEFISQELCSILEDFGFTTKGYTNPEDVIKAVHKERPDLICTDLKMPQMSGMQLLEKVRGDKIDCPVVFITGFVDNDLLTQGLDNGASGFLEKPFEEDQVVSLATQAVDRFRTKRLLNRSIN